MISQPLIFDVLEQRVKERDAVFKSNLVKIEIRKPFKISEAFFKSGINFETPQKIASFTIWEREIIQVVVIVMDVGSLKDEVMYDGEVDSPERVLEIFDELCDSLL